MGVYNDKWQYFYLINAKQIQTPLCVIPDNAHSGHVNIFVLDLFINIPCFYV